MSGRALREAQRDVCHMQEPRDVQERWQPGMQTPFLLDLVMKNGLNEKPHIFKKIILKSSGIFSLHYVFFKYRKLLLLQMNV